MDKRRETLYDDQIKSVREEKQRIMDTIVADNKRLSDSGEKIAMTGEAMAAKLNVVAEKVDKVLGGAGCQSGK